MLSYIFPSSQNSTFSIYKFHTMSSKSVLVKLSPYFVVGLNKQVLYFYPVLKSILKILIIILSV